MEQTEATKQMLLQSPDFCSIRPSVLRNGIHDVRTLLCRNLKNANVILPVTMTPYPERIGGPCGLAGLLGGFVES